jgi:hypothetical protein
MDAHRNQKRIWETKRRTLESRLVVTPQSKHKQAPHNTIRLPSYFKDEVESYKTVKLNYETCKTALCDVNTRICQLHSHLMDLSEKSSNPEYMSPELHEHTTRAHERLQRVNARLDGEYRQQIVNVRARILEFETKLANIGSSPVEHEFKVAIPIMSVQPVHPVQPVKNRRELKMAQMQALTIN